MDVVKSSRLPWVDYARGIAIILVVYRHIFEGMHRAHLGTDQYDFLEHANIIFYSFRMPLFFILSGVFIGRSLQKRGLGAMVRNKFNTILYPYFIWSFIQVTMQILLDSYANANRTTGDYLYILFYPRQIDQFWYLYALFNVTVLYMFTREKLKLSIWHQLAIGVIFFGVSSYLSQHTIDWGFVYDVIHYYIFFAIGDLISDKLLNKDMTPTYSSWKLFGALLPIFIVGQYYFLNKNLEMKMPEYAYVEFFQPVWFMLIALSGCAFMINISFILQRYKILKVIRMFGYHSLYIYVAHVLVASGLRTILVKAGLTYVPFMLFIIIALALTIPVIMYNLAMQAGAWWLYSLERPKRPALQTQTIARNND